MVNDAVLNGIRQAVSKGYSLQQAMLSFFNAGYSREDVQEAARQFQLEQVQNSQPTQPVQQQIQKPIQQQVTQPLQQRFVQPIQKPQQVQQQFAQQSVQQIQQPIAKPVLQKFVQPISKPQVASFPQTNQAISGYPPQQKSVSKGIVITLIVLLIILIGVLASTILFKEQIINFFNGA